MSTEVAKAEKTVPKPPVSTKPLAEADPTAEEIAYKQFESFLKKTQPKKIGLFTHSSPDPDAISSLMAIRLFLERKFGLEANAFYSGKISHPQNRSMINLLDPDLIPVEEYSFEEYDFNIIVDTVPDNAGVKGNEINFNVVIDHHKETPSGDFDGLFINLKAGSCAATIYSLMREGGFVFDTDNDYDTKVATALMVGIITDTEYQMSDDTTSYEHDAYRKLFEYCDTRWLKQIINFQRPKYWVELKVEASPKTTIEDGVGVVGLGVIPAKHRDVIADMADEICSWEDVQTAIVFAVIDGGRLDGSVRSQNPSISVPELCHELGNKGRGGGKLGKGAYSYDLGHGGIDDDDDDETKATGWARFEKKEKRRIFRTISKS